MVDAAVQMGFDEHSLIICKTNHVGCISSHQQCQLSLDELIKAVASKGGTTEAALSVFEKNNLVSTIQQALFCSQKE